MTVDQQSPMVTETFDGISGPVGHEMSDWAVSPS